MTTCIYKTITTALLIGSAIACHEKTIERKTDNPNLAINQKVNNFTEQQMKDVYLWTDQIQDRHIDNTLDPNVFLKRMMYTEEDTWSYITEEPAGTRSFFEGYEFGYGYHLMFFLSGTKVIAEVAYVYPGTPASKAGLKRGDIITKNNGSFMDRNNYTALYYDNNVRLQLATLIDHTLVTQEKTYTLAAQRFEFNPVLINTVLTWGQKKVGYLHYTEFSDNNESSLASLSQAVGELKEAQVDELVLDLRYNPGGHLTAAIWFSSLLAPSEAVNRKATLITMEWNKKFQQIYQNTPKNLQEQLDPEALPNNLNLSRLYVLIGPNTASASELLISGLRPYIPQIILIGAKTVGKYVGSKSCIPTDKEIENWTLLPIVFSYKNIHGESVRGGLAPTYQQEDDTAYPLASPEEPLLKAALNLIGGQPVITATIPFHKRANHTPLQCPRDQARQLLVR